MLLLLHGAVGNLDELLACAAGIALVLIIIFVVELRAKRESPGAESQTSQPPAAELGAARVNPEPHVTNPKA